MLDLESEAMRGLGSIPTGGNILSLDFFLFSRSKVKNANIGILVQSVKNSSVIFSNSQLWFQFPLEAILVFVETFKNLSMPILYKMSDLCYLRKPRVHFTCSLVSLRLPNRSMSNN